MNFSFVFLMACLVLVFMSDGSYATSVILRFGIIVCSNNISYV